MALTTVVRGRAYDWSHAIGRGAATGTGFNYVQTMCLGNDGDLYAANRGNENNFGMRVNRIKLGGPGDEELLAEFFQHGEGDGNATWPFGVAVGQNGHVYCSDEWTNTISVFDANGKFQFEVGQDRQRRRRVDAPGRACVSRRTATSSSSTAATIGCRCSRRKASWWRSAARAESGDGEFNQPWGITLDKDGNIYVADWKNHRVQKLSPQGQVT